MGSLTILDLLILAAIGIGVWQGGRTGAVRQVMGVLALVIGLWVAAIAMIPAGTALALVFAVPEPISPVVGFVVVCTGVVAVLLVAGYLLRRTLRLLRLGLLDRGLGALLGGLRSAVVVSLILLVTSSVAIPGSGGLFVGMETRERSLLHEPVSQIAPALWDVVRLALPALHEAIGERFYRFAEID